jgi:autoinducer 2 (AI-2) kinase
MTEQYLMAIDIGTGRARAVVFDTEGNQVSVGEKEWTHKPSPEYPGASDFDTRENWTILCQCMQEAIKNSGTDPENIVGISCSTMRLATVCYDADGQEVFACTNTDARAIEETKQLIEDGLAEKIYEIDGEFPACESLARLLWIRNKQPDVFEKIRHLNMLPDWVLYKLSGEHATEPSAAGCSGMFDGRNRTWSTEILEWCDLPTEFLPPVHESGTAIGRVTAQAAEETGLAEGTWVVLGGGDTMCGLAGVGSVKAGDATIQAGSFWGMEVLTDRMIIDPEIRMKTIPHVVPGLWLFEGVGFYTGLMVRWYRDSFCREDVAKARADGFDDYHYLDGEAAEVPPGSHGVQVFIGDLQNIRRWMHCAPTFMGWDIHSPEMSNKYVFFRALLENGAYQTLGHYQRLDELRGEKIQEVTMFGGGAQSKLWPQIVADVLQVPVRIPVVKEATAFGAALCAGVGAGIYESLPDIAPKLVQWERVHEPTKDQAVKDVYMRQYEQWRSIYQHLLDLVDMDLIAPMWRSAGA